MAEGQVHFGTRREREISLPLLFPLFFFGAALKNCTLSDLSWARTKLRLIALTSTSALASEMPCRVLRNQKVCPESRNLTFKLENYELSFVLCLGRALEHMWGARWIAGRCGGR